VNKRWLPISILLSVGSIVFLAMVHYGTCKFYENPKQFSLYERSGGKLPDQEHETCKGVGDKTLAVLTSVLATLLALHSEPPTDG
jgi:hypothetical protein